MKTDMAITGHLYFQMQTKTKNKNIEIVAGQADS